MLADSIVQWLFIIIGGMGAMILFILSLFLPPLIKEIQTIRRDLHRLIVGYENRLTQLETFQRIFIKSRTGGPYVEDSDRTGNRS